MFFVSDWWRLCLWYLFYSRYSCHQLSLSTLDRFFGAGGPYNATHVYYRSFLSTGHLPRNIKPQNLHPKKDSMCAVIWICLKKITPSIPVGGNEPVKTLGDIALPEHLKTFPEFCYDSVPDGCNINSPGEMGVRESWSFLVTTRIDYLGFRILELG